MVNEPRLLKGSGETSDASTSFMVSKLDGYYAQVTVMIDGLAPGSTATATEPKNNITYDSGVSGGGRLILVYPIENLTEHLYNIITVSPVPTTWRYKFLVTFHRNTGTYGVVE